MRTRGSLLTISGLVGELALLGCQADRGEACKEDDDCSAGLVCCKPGSRTGRGVCETSCDADDAGTIPFDSGPLVRDASTIDAGTVDAGTVDAGTVDAGIVDASTSDAGTVDAGTVDAGTGDAST